MQIARRTEGDITILDLQGRLTLGKGHERLRDEVKDLLHQGHRKLVLNLEDVPYVDSWGLGELVKTYTAVTHLGGVLKLVNLGTRVRNLLTITRLSTVFDTFESEPEAIGSFLPAPPTESATGRS